MKPLDKNSFSAVANVPAPASASVAAAASTQTSFASLGLPSDVLSNLQALGYLQMTPIQAASLPLALAGHDLIAQAKTGSGKTAAFGLALLQRLVQERFEVQSLVLCPTRELAEQITQELRRLARALGDIKILTLCGGSALRPQIDSLAHGAHVVVGTPGRILDHLARGSLQLQNLNTLVLDEADRMLDMGFFDDISNVAKQCAGQRQTLLFSATYPAGIERLASALLREPKRVQLAEPVAAAQIKQLFFEVTEEQRLHSVGQLLNHYRPVSTLAFCNTKQQCRDLAQVLRAQGFSALELHGELEQRDRDQVLVQFAQRSASVLVATDIAARGLDIEQLQAVINVDISPDPATHTHRIGRTGRVDQVGLALSLASVDEMGRVGQIEQAGGFSSEWQRLDSLQATSAEPLMAPMVTLQILGGRKQKIRAGDVLGALTKDMGFEAAQIGKIHINEYATYVAVQRQIAPQVLRSLNAGKVKGRAVKARSMGVS